MDKKSISWPERIYRSIQSFITDPTASVKATIVNSFDNPVNIKNQTDLLSGNIMKLEIGKIYKLNGYGEVKIDREFIVLQISGEINIQVGFEKNVLDTESGSPFLNETVGFNTCYGFIRCLAVSGSPVVKVPKGYFSEVIE